MSRSHDSIPTPPVWRRTGKVETHVPTMSAAEKDWRRRNGAVESARAPVPAPRPLEACFTALEMRVFRAIHVAPRGQLTLGRIVTAQNLWGQVPLSDIQAAVTDLYNRGYLRRRPGRGGPYALTPDVEAMLS